MLPNKEERLQCVVPNVHFPRGGLVTAPLPVQVQRGVLLQDIDVVPQIHAVEVVPQSNYVAGRPWEPWKWVLKFVSVLGEAKPIDLR